MEFGYSGSVYSKTLANFLKNIGTKQTHVFTEYSIENTKAVDMLLGIKYISLFNNQECIKQYNHLKDYKNDCFSIYENLYNLSLGYKVNNKVLDLEYEESNNAFSKQNNILKSITGIQEDVYTSHIGDVLKNTKDVQLEEGKYIEIGDNPTLIYEFDVESEDNIYVYMFADDNKKVRIFINGEEKDTYFISYPNEMINLGKRKIGEKVKLEICLEAEEICIQDIYIYYENEEVLAKHYEKLKEEQIDFEEKNSRILSGKINLKEESIVMITIPYEEGWKITVDGKEVEYMKVLDAFIGINVGQGEHEVVLKYTPPKFKLGIILSISGIIIFLSIIIIPKKVKK